MEIKATMSVDEENASLYVQTTRELGLRYEQDTFLFFYDYSYRGGPDLRFSPCQSDKTLEDPYIVRQWKNLYAINRERMVIQGVLYACGIKLGPVTTWGSCYHDPNASKARYALGRCVKAIRMFRADHTLSREQAIQAVHLGTKGL